MRCHYPKSSGVARWKRRLDGKFHKINKSSLLTEDHCRLRSSSDLPIAFTALNVDIAPADARSLSPRGINKLWLEVQRQCISQVANRSRITYELKSEFNHFKGHRWRRDNRTLPTSDSASDCRIISSC
jgi:hypothetical protein